MLDKSFVLGHSIVHYMSINQILEALRSLTSSWRPLGFVFRGLWLLTLCDPRRLIFNIIRHSIIIILYQQQVVVQITG